MPLWTHLANLKLSAPEKRVEGLHGPSATLNGADALLERQRQAGVAWHVDYPRQNPHFSSVSQSYPYPVTSRIGKEETLTHQRSSGRKRDGDGEGEGQEGQDGLVMPVPTLVSSSSALVPGNSCSRTRRMEMPMPMPQLPPMYTPPRNSRTVWNGGLNLDPTTLLVSTFATPPRTPPTRTPPTRRSNTNTTPSSLCQTNVKVKNGIDSPEDKGRCAGTTAAGKRCTKPITKESSDDDSAMDALHRMLMSDSHAQDESGSGTASGRGVELPRFCHQHAKQALSEVGTFAGPRGIWIVFSDWIPEHLPSCTQVDLRLALSTPPTDDDKRQKGYIYVHEWAPVTTTTLSGRSRPSPSPSRRGRGAVHDHSDSDRDDDDDTYVDSDTDTDTDTDTDLDSDTQTRPRPRPQHRTGIPVLLTHIKLGRSVKPVMRHAQWSAQCPSRIPIVRGFFPRVTGGDGCVGVRGAHVVAESGITCHKMWERLCLLELAGWQVLARRNICSGEMVETTPSRSSRSSNRGNSGRGRGRGRGRGTPGGVRRRREGQVECVDCGKKHQEVFELQVGAYEQVVQGVVERWQRYCQDILA